MQGVAKIFVQIILSDQRQVFKNILSMMSNYLIGDGRDSQAPLPAQQHC